MRKVIFPTIGAVRADDIPRDNLVSKDNCCPACASEDTIPIEYGLSTLTDPDKRKAVEDGLLAPGPCLVFPDSPTRRCKACEAGFRIETIQ